MQRYPEYKESGVEWIGEIATCPEATRLKYICELIVDCEHKTAPTQETGYPLIRTPNIGIGYLILDGVNRVSEEIYQEWSRRTIPQSGDLILAREAPVGNVAIIPKDLKVCLGQRTVLIRPDKNKVCSIFLVYLMLGDETQTRLLGRSTGATVHHLNMTDIRNLELPILPPLPVQTQIAAFLDRKTGQIDELIHLKERRIELLQEQRTALINQAVTKGLDPTVEMKPSGVEWIGEIPAHWEIGKIKHIATFVSEKSTPEIDAIKISPENVESETGRVLDFCSSYDSVGVKFQAGDVLFNKLRVYLSKVVFAKYGGYSLGEMIVIRPSLQRMAKYLFYLMLSSRFIEYCNAISYGVKMPRTAVDDILDAQIPMTSDQEQAQIANFLDRKTQHIDELISTEHRKIELLKEYRQSLISEAVTGKIDVQNEV